MTDQTARLRFSAQGGDIYERIGEMAVRVSLEEAVARLEGWGRKALEAEQRGDYQLARVYARDSLALSLAASAAMTWQRGSGPNPSADLRREEVA